MKPPTFHRDAGEIRAGNAAPLSPAIAPDGLCRQHTNADQQASQHTHVEAMAQLPAPEASGIKNKSSITAPGTSHRADQLPRLAVTLKQLEELKEEQEVPFRSRGGIRRGTVSRA